MRKRIELKVRGDFDGYGQRLHFNVINRASGRSFGGGIALGDDVAWNKRLLRNAIRQLRLLLRKDRIERNKA